MSNVLMIEEQGSFFAGGTVITADGQYTTENPGNHEGQTFHGDHVYVSYQKPVDAKQLPIVFLHGAGQSGKTWESTPDGRERGIAHISLINLVVDVPVTLQSLKRLMYNQMISFGMKISAWGFIQTCMNQGDSQKIAIA